MKKIIPFFLLLIMLSASCKNTWSDEDKDAFYQACTGEAINWAGSPEKAKTYCDCVFSKMAQKYPHEEDALEHIDSLAQDTSLISCKDEILKK